MAQSLKGGLYGLPSKRRLEVCAISETVHPCIAHPCIARMLYTKNRQTTPVIRIGLGPFLAGWTQHTPPISPGATQGCAAFAVTSRCSAN